LKKEEILAFSEAIEELVYKYDVSYMEAIVMYCESSGLEIEMAAKLISTNLESHITLEAQKLKMIKTANTGQLPF
jgi:hypothetical protein